MKRPSSARAVAKAKGKTTTKGIGNDKGRGNDKGKAKGNGKDEKGTGKTAALKRRSWLIKEYHEMCADKGRDEAMKSFTPYIAKLGGAKETCQAL